MNASNSVHHFEMWSSILSDRKKITLLRVGMKVVSVPIQKYERREVRNLWKCREQGVSIGIGGRAENRPNDIGDSTISKRNTGNQETCEVEFDRFGGKGTPLATKLELKTISCQTCGVDQPTIYIPGSTLKF